MTTEPEPEPQPETQPEPHRPTLMTVHAHPDDETIGTGGAMVKAIEAGHRVVLVTGTRGELAVGRALSAKIEEVGGRHPTLQIVERDAVDAVELRRVGVRQRSQRDGDEGAEHGGQAGEGIDEAHGLCPHPGGK